VRRDDRRRCAGQVDVAGVELFLVLGRVARAKLPRVRLEDEDAFPQ
jgi:hypothetical protein